MKTCIHEDCVIVWEEYSRVSANKPCPVCAMQEHIDDVEKDNSNKDDSIIELHEQIADLQEEIASLKQKEE